MANSTNTYMFYVHAGVRLQNEAAVRSKIDRILSSSNINSPDTQNDTNANKAAPLDLEDWLLGKYFRGRLLHQLSQSSPAVEHRLGYERILAPTPVRLRPRLARNLWFLLLRMDVLEWPDDAGLVDIAELVGYARACRSPAVHHAGDTGGNKANSTSSSFFRNTTSSEPATRAMGIGATACVTVWGPSAGSSSPTRILVEPHGCGLPGHDAPRSATASASAEAPSASWRKTPIINDDWLTAPDYGTPQHGRTATSAGTELPSPATQVDLLREQGVHHLESHAATTGPTGGPFSGPATPLAPRPPTSSPAQPLSSPSSTGLAPYSGPLPTVQADPTPRRLGKVFSTLPRPGATTMPPAQLRAQLNTIRNLNRRHSHHGLQHKVARDALRAVSGWSGPPAPLTEERLPPRAYEAATAEASQAHTVSVEEDSVQDRAPWEEVSGVAPGDS